MATPIVPMMIATAALATAALLAANTRAEAGDAPSPRPVTQADAHAGKDLYRGWCSGCHGEHADGKGPLAEFLEPPPRDFTTGKFKLRSTPAGQPPATTDILRTIERGVPGTAMPSFALLSTQDRKALAAYVLEVAEYLKTPEPSPIALPDKEPRSTPQSVALGKKVYESVKCSACHGLLGKGDGPSAADLVDDYDKPIKVRDFTTGVFRGGNERADLYHRFIAGMDGTPMASFADAIKGTDARWELIDYVLSLRAARPQAPIPGGETVAGHKDGAIQPPYFPRAGEFWKEPAPPQGATRVAHGKWLFRQKGCIMCHGEEGRGGVPNFNYSRDTVPTLSGLAEVMRLSDSSEAKEFISLVERGVSIKDLKSDQAIRRWSLVQAQYGSVCDVIREGRTPLKKDLTGPEPPLRMPSWGKRLTGGDIDSVIAYLVSLQKWEEEEEVVVAKRPASPSPVVASAAQPPTSAGPASSVPAKPLRSGETAPDAVLADQNGRKFHLSDLRGNVVVITFIYTHCHIPEKCPLVTTKLVEARRSLAQGPAKGVQFLLVSFDGQRDRPEELKKFLSQYANEPDAIRLASGSAEQVSPLCERFSTVVREESPGVFDHNIVVSLLDRKGVLRENFPGTAWNVKDLVSAITDLSRQ